MEGPLAKPGSKRWGTPFLYREFDDEVRHWIVAFDSGGRVEEFCVVISKFQDQIILRLKELIHIKNHLRALLFILPEEDLSERETEVFQAKNQNWKEQLAHTTPMASARIVGGEVTFQARPAPFGINLHSEKVCVILVQNQ